MKFTCLIAVVRSCAVVAVAAWGVVGVESCDEECTGSPGSVLMGTMSGIVQQADYKSVFIVPAAGATVKLQYTTFRTTTDSTGRWYLNNVPAGVYTLVYSKPGFQDWVNPMLSFVGGGSLFYDLRGRVVQAPPNTIQDFRAVDTTIGGVPVLRVHWFNDTTYATSAFMFVGTSPNVSKDPARWVKMYGAYNDTKNGVKGNTVDFSLPLYDFQLAGLHAGDTIYAVAYPAAYNYTGYIDTASGRYYYTGLGETPSIVVRASVP